MQIATWNVERLKHKRDLDSILAACYQAKADILVLTETDSRVHLDYPYYFQTQYLAERKPSFYQPTETRVSIFTRYRCVRQHPTYDNYTSLCVELETERGNLLVYGTIIGVYGNRLPPFKDDLMRQCVDFSRLAASGTSLCICGDYNLSFSDNYYFTNWGRGTIRQTFSKHGIKLLTSGQLECIDHIAISERFAAAASIEVEEWNEDKKLSDHKGIAVRLSWDSPGT